MTTFTRIPSVTVVMTGLMSDMGLTIPTSFVGNTDLTVAQLLQHLNNIGQELCTGYDWQFLHKTQTITGDGTTTLFDLPADFNGYANDTMWNNTSRLPAIGPMTPQLWRELKARLLGGSTISIQYRVVGNQVEFYIPPAAGTSIQVDYYSRGWVQDAADFTFGDTITKDSDLLYFDQRILASFTKLRWRETKGFDTTAAAAEASSIWDMIVGRDTPAPAINLAKATEFPLLGFRNIADTGYGL